MFGSVLGTMEARKQAILDILNVTYDVLMRILNAVIWYVCKKLPNFSKKTLTLAAVTSITLT